MNASNSGTLRAHLVDVPGRCRFPAELRWQDGRITAITRVDAGDDTLPYLLPGFIDAHVHIESSLLPPAEFARIAVRHGTVASVSDPHEIANVLGSDGVRWMLANAAQTPFHVLFGAPACVPATDFETAGAVLDADAVAVLLDTPGVGYLSEVMNYPGVLAGDSGLLAKIAAATSRGLPVDGHAPGLGGDDAARYAAAGISTDHECMTLAEAENKLRAGMSILLREGSAARNFDALHPLLKSHPGRVMFCSDDRHPDDLVAGHINTLVVRAIAHGHDVFDVLDAACLAPQRHYFRPAVAAGRMADANTAPGTPADYPLGALRIGDPFNAVLVDDLKDFRVRATWLDGVCAAANGRSLLPRSTPLPVNRFAAGRIEAGELRVAAGAVLTTSPRAVAEDSHAPAIVRTRVIVATDGDLYTREAIAELASVEDCLQPSLADDVLLLAVVNRYRQAPPAVAFIRGFALRAGALASSVAHDSHNVIGVGCSARELATALNTVITAQGGLALVDGIGHSELLPLPIAGLMSSDDGDQVAARYAALNRAARERLGSPLRAPFMTLSFMALLVIPELKLGDRGLFDGRRFLFTEPACRL